MHGFRPQRMISESSKNSSREIEVAKPQTYDEQFKTIECAAAFGYNSGFHRNYNVETRTSLSSHETQKVQLDEKKRRSCSCVDSPAHSEHSTFVIENEKENLTVQDAIKRYDDIQNVKHKTKQCLTATKSSELLNSAADVTGGGTDSLSHKKCKCSSWRSFRQSSEGVKDCQEKPKQHFKCTECQNHHPKHNADLGECKSDEEQTKCEYAVNNTEIGSFENDFSHVKNDASGNIPKANCDKGTNVFKERDDIINDYQLQEMICHKAIKQKLDEDYTEIQKLRKNYSSLKKLFLALATLNIILILCVVSVMPVILVTFKLSGGDGKVPSDEDIEHISAEHLSSTEAKKVVKEHILCVDCQIIKEQWSDIFTRESGKGCCLENVAKLVDKVLGLNEKKLNSVVNRKIKHYTHRMEGDISDLQSVVFDKPFNTNGTEGRIIPRRQIENLHGLVNTLLARKRSAIHLSGTFKHHTMTWTQSFPKSTTTNLRHRNNAIHVDNEGVYFLYSCIRFEIGQCDRKQSVGYQIAVKHRERRMKVLASIQHPCVDGKSSETDLIIQKIVHVPVSDQGDASTTTLHVEIEFSPGLVAQDHHHSFGLFEI